MKPLFTIHEGEFLVGDHIIRKLSGKYDVWVPAKDEGVDLLITAKRGRPKPVKLQVKFSRGYDPKRVSSENLLAWGWFTLNPTKIKRSRADLWVFVILTLQHQAHYILVPTQELKKRIPKRHPAVWHLYLAAFRGKRCYDVRGLVKSEIATAITDGVADSARDYSDYLGNWRLLDQVSR